MTLQDLTELTGPIAMLFLIIGLLVAGFIDDQLAHRSRRRHWARMRQRNHRNWVKIQKSIRR